MKITSIKLYHAKLKLKKAFTTSLLTRTHTNNIFIQINTNAGLTGWGESSPNLHILGETVETSKVIGKLIAQQLIGKDPRETDVISKLMDKVIFGHTGIKSAFDLACHDLAAKSCDEPLYLHLGGSIEKKIYTDYTISLADPELMADQAEEKVEEGFKTLKVKLGQDGHKDVDRIRSIRAAIGDAIDIRVDANQGWKTKEAIATLNALKENKIQYCEEPINRKEYFKLKKVRKHTSIPIMADESLFDHLDARKLIKGKLCDMINIKLGKSSGLYKAQKIVEEATKANIPMQVGGFLESRLTMTANCHLAYKSPLIQYYDLDCSLFLEEDPIIGGMEFQNDWEVRIPESAGLGLEIDRKFLDKCEHIEIK